jgi:hypothetical protein
MPQNFLLRNAVCLFYAKFATSLCGVVLIVFAIERRVQLLPSAEGESFYQLSQCMNIKGYSSKVLFIVSSSMLSK